MPRRWGGLWSRRTGTSTRTRARRDVGQDARAAHVHVASAATLDPHPGDEAQPAPVARKRRARHAERRHGVAIHAPVSAWQRRRWGVGLRLHLRRDQQPRRTHAHGANVKVAPRAVAAPHPRSRPGSRRAQVALERGVRRHVRLQRVSALARDCRVRVCYRVRTRSSSSRVAHFRMPPPPTPPPPPPTLPPPRKSAAPPPSSTKASSHRQARSEESGGGQWRRRLRRRRRGRGGRCRRRRRRCRQR